MDTIVTIQGITYLNNTPIQWVNLHQLDEDGDVTSITSWILHMN